MTTQINWQAKTFSQLSIDELYDILKLRIDVFVVEQTCYYPDIDGLDRHKDTIHLFCYIDNEISCYLRILAKGLTYENYISIGRVIVAPIARGKGLGDELLIEALSACQQYFPEQTIKISAQEHLEKYYNKHGFNRVTEMYLEDDIPHIGMIKQD